MQPPRIPVDSRSIAAMRGSLSRSMERVPEDLRTEALATALGYGSAIELRRAAWSTELRSIRPEAFSARLAESGWIVAADALTRAIADAWRSTPTPRAQERCTEGLASRDEA